MTVTQRIMKPGSFALKLDDPAPLSVIRAVAEFDHVVITRSRLDPIAGFTDATILANAIYTGVITRRPSPSEFSGYDLSWWLGTPDGAGDLLTTAVSRTAGTLSQWITDLCPASLTVGSVSNTGLGTLTNSYQWMTPREAIDAVCRALGAEWRVNPDGTIDAAKTPNLFVATPTVVVTRKEEGPDGAYRGLDSVMAGTARDVEQYVTAVTAVANGQGTTVATGSAAGSTSYKDFRNGTVVLERLANAPTEPGANASAVAAAVVAQFNTVRRAISLTSRTYTVTRFVKPGDYVYVYDQLADLTDNANQIFYRGELISPIALRVYSLTWPIAAGMGVYARRSGATPTYTDLTDWVEWESGDVTWDVGVSPRSASDTDASTAGSAAYLGSNAEISARATDQANAWQTPTLGSSWVNYGAPYQAASYRRVGDRVELRGVIKSGTLGAAAFTLPTGYRPPADHLFAQVCAGGSDQFGSLYVSSAGVVQPNSGANAWFSIDCSFSVAA